MIAVLFYLLYLFQFLNWRRNKEKVLARLHRKTNRIRVSSSKSSASALAFIHPCPRLCQLSTSLRPVCETRRGNEYDIQRHILFLISTSTSKTYVRFSNKWPNFSKTIPRILRNFNFVTKMINLYLEEFLTKHITEFKTS